MSADGWVMVIGAIAAGIVLVITATGTIVSALGNRRKLNAIHGLADSGLTTVTDELVAARKELASARKELKQVKQEIAKLKEAKK